jgi:acetylornithine deacetylase/succinyl-diaminopimelate desuccinylase family protein
MPLPSLTELLRELVRRPSVNPMGRTDLPAHLLYESRVADYLFELLKTIGATVVRQKVAPGRDNIIATHAHPAATRTLIFQAHTDTVPVDGMSIDPFGAEIRDGKLFGRGACDVKAGVTAVLTAFVQTVENNCPVHLTAAFTVDEEHTFLGIEQFAKTARADFAVVSEPTGLDLVTSHKGVVRWQLVTRGLACHSSRPERGRNAIYSMANLIHAISNYSNELIGLRRHPQLGTATLSAGRIDGGVAANTVPDRCTLDLDRRLIPGETAAGAEAELRGRLDAAGVPYELSRIFDGPALAAAESPELARLSNIILSQRGAVPERMAAPYATDAGTLAARSIPCVVFGPGDIAQAHTADEWVELAQVEAAAEILFRFARGAA